MVLAFSALDWPDTGLLQTDDPILAGMSAVVIHFFLLAVHRDVRSYGDARISGGEMGWTGAGLYLLPVYVQFSFALLSTELAKRENDKLSFDMYAQTEKLKAIFLRRNYPNLPEDVKSVFELFEVRMKHIANGSAAGHFVTQINDTVERSKNRKLCVVIGNVELLESNFVATLNRKPNR